MQESPYLEGHESLVEKFQRLPFLESLDPKYLKKILRLSKIRKYEAGEVVTPEGTYDSWVYIILSGAVRVVKQEQEIARLDHVGDAFGELAVIDGQRRSASVQTITETVCLAIDASFLDRAEESHERTVFFSIFYRIFAEIVAQRLRLANEEMVGLREEIERLKREKNSPRA
ncbi:MAG: cyclic nucleotide-binding domain-containing protein [Thermodesulfobacteriota bacterium]